MLSGIKVSQENGDMIIFVDPVTGSDVIIYVVDSSWNVMVHGDAGKGSEGETGEWSV